MKLKCPHCRVENNVNSKHTTIKNTACSSCRQPLELFPLELFEDTGYFRDDFDAGDVEELSRTAARGARFGLIKEPFIFFHALMLALSVGLTGLLARTAAVSPQTFLSLSIYIVGFTLLAAAGGLLVKRLTLFMTIMLPLLFQVKLLVLLTLLHHTPFAILRQTIVALAAGAVLYISWRKSGKTIAASAILPVLLLFVPTVLWPLSLSFATLSALFLYVTAAALIYGLLAPSPDIAASCRFLVYVLWLMYVVYFMMGREAPVGSKIFVTVLCVLIVRGLAVGMEHLHRSIRLNAALARWDCRFRIVNTLVLSPKNKRYFLRFLPFMSTALKKELISITDVHLWLTAGSRQLHQQVKELTRTYVKKYREPPSRPRSTVSAAAETNPLCVYFRKVFSMEVIPRLEKEKKVTLDAERKEKLKRRYLGDIHGCVETRNKRKSWQAILETLKSYGKEGFHHSLSFIRQLQTNGMHAEAIDLIYTFMTLYNESQQQEILSQLLNRLEFAFSIRMGWGRPYTLDTMEDRRIKPGISRLHIFNNTPHVSDKRKKTAFEFEPGTALQVILKGEDNLHYFYLEPGQGSVVDAPPGQYQLMIHFNGMEVPYLYTGWKFSDNRTPTHLSMEVPYGYR
jgi:hypothetical protein